MLEIERKFLIDEETLNKYILQYKEVRSIEDIYLFDTVRLRRIIGGEVARYVLTKKSEGTIVREEEEKILSLNSTIYQLFNEFPVLSKLRYKVDIEGKEYEFNKFINIRFQKEPLIIMEVEMNSPDEEILKLGKEITQDINYYGYNLWNNIRIGNTIIKK